MNYTPDTIAKPGMCGNLKWVPWVKPPLPPAEAVAEPLQVATVDQRCAAPLRRTIRSRFFVVRAVSTWRPPYRETRPRGWRCAAAAAVEEFSRG